MKLDAPFSILAHDVDIAALAAACERASEVQWRAWDFRQASYNVHASTKSIPFLWSDSAGLRTASIELNRDTLLWELVRPHVAHVEQVFGGIANKIMLVSLAPHAEIPLHVDGGPVLSNVHRCHLPIVTSPAVEFFIGGEICRLELGTWYEIDNTRLYGVTNRSAIARVHLIVDVAVNTD